MPGIDEDVALVNVRLAKFSQTGFHQAKPDALLAIPLGHRKMMQITAAPVMTTQYRTHNLALLHRDKTQAGIPAQE